MLSFKKLTFFGEKSLFVGRGLRKPTFTPSHQGIILKRWNDNIYVKSPWFNLQCTDYIKAQRIFDTWISTILSSQYNTLDVVQFCTTTWKTFFIIFFALSISPHNMKWKSVIEIEKYADRATKEFQLSWREKDRWTCS